MFQARAVWAGGSIDGLWHAGPGVVHSMRSSGPGDVVHVTCFNVGLSKRLRGSIANTPLCAQACRAAAELDAVEAPPSVRLHEVGRHLKFDPLQCVAFHAQVDNEDPRRAHASHGSAHT